LKLSKLPSVHIACACGHVEQLTGTMLAAAGVKPDQRLMGIERRLPAGTATNAARSSSWSNGTTLRPALVMLSFDCSRVDAARIARALFPCAQQRASRLEGIDFMYVLKRQDDDKPMWLLSVEPQGWGGRDHAMRFGTREEARRAAAEIKLSGDWLIHVAGETRTFAGFANE
jgi:hypothetical protein